MRNLLQFILKHSNLLLFILLEVAALVLVITTQPYQRSRVLAGSNRVVAGLNEQGDRWHDYFHLTEQNRVLVEQNAALRNQLSNLQQTDFSYQGAKVIDLTTNSEHNHFTINRGSEDGVSVEMGVRNADGVVGVVSEVGKHYAVCVPLIHTQYSLSCRLKKNRYVGFTEWKGLNYRFVQLNDVGRHIEVEEGDTVVTSGLTQSFEEGVPVGVVEKVKTGDGENYQTIRVRLMVDYRRLEYVEVGGRYALD